MTVTATFAAATGLLTIIGDALDDVITVSRDPAGDILVDGGAVFIVGGAPTVANTTVIEAFGEDGADTITLNEAGGALPGADVFGGAGADRLTGGSGADLLFGEAGADVLNGGGGNDQLFGGDGNDILTGGPGNDQVFGQAGNDTMIWNPGDGSDLLEGGDGVDTAVINGGNGDETFAITANGTRVRFDRLDPAPFTLDIGTTENLVLHANGGNDVITAGNGLAGLIHLTLDGGAGNDTITGGDGDDTLIGGAGNDVVTGGRGSDTAFLGAGDDTYIWNPGDGSDTVEGQGGLDTLQFNGANVSENIDLSANGDRVTLTRDVGAVTMDLHQVEDIDLAMRGGADNVTVHDLAGTGVQRVSVDLSATPGSGVGDGAADTVTAEGGAAADHIRISGAGGAVAVAGLAAQVAIAGAEGANDSLVVSGLGGDDVIDASALPAGVIGLTIDGGDGADTIVGSQGADVLIGGAGNDVVTGGRGDDIAFLGDGDDRYIWNPGDGSDTVEGQGGIDTLLFNGSNANENINIFANGSRVTLTRDVGDVVMDLNGIEDIRLRAGGGADTVVVNDLTGTDVRLVAVDLGAAGGAGPDGSPDQVIVNGPAGGHVIKIVGAGSAIAVTGLSAQTTILNADATLDTLVVNGQSGDDTIDASGLAAGHIGLKINGGDGNDLLVGSAGDDIVSGGRGSDTALLGAGNDTYIWNPGDGSDVVEGQGGYDTLLFNGANVNENIDISANGSRARLTRDVGNIAMDLNGMEQIDFATLGGADNVTVDDLTGTGLQKVAIDLGSDGQVDTVTVNGTSGADSIKIADISGVVTVTGLAATVTISNFDASDRLVVNGLGGDDFISALGLGKTLQLTESGGDGNDTLLGSAGNDTLLGGAGNDLLAGEGGFDILDGGAGTNTIVGSLLNPPGLLAPGAFAGLSHA